MQHIGEPTSRLTEVMPEGLKLRLLEGLLGPFHLRTCHLRCGMHTANQVMIWHLCLQNGKLHSWE